MDISPRFEPLVTRLVERLGDLHRVPTIAAPEDIERALKEMPRALPSIGYGVQEAADFVERVIIPGLAQGHAGPRSDRVIGSPFISWA